MKKSYIIPNTTVTVLNSCEHLLQSSITDITGLQDVGLGGESTGNMTSDVKTSSYSVWDDDWSK